MRSLFREIFEELGAEVMVAAPGELDVKVSRHSPAECLLRAPSRHRLSFDPESKPPNAVLVTQGSTFLETTALRLSQMGAARHGILPVQYQGSRKILKNKCRVFGDTEANFSSRRGWQVRVRIWLKIKLAGDEVEEILEGFEIPSDRQPFKLESQPSTDRNVRWVDKPPLRRYRLEQLVDAGFRFAENQIVAKAENLQKKNLKTLYPALKRLRSYYRQLAGDARARDGEEAGAAIVAEYRRRLRDEVQYACLKATADLIALETISTPVQHLQWQLLRNGKSKAVNAVLNLYDGSLESGVRCEVCGNDSGPVGLSNSNSLVCADCWMLCNTCGAEIIDRQGLANRTCSVCNQTVCSEHGLNCKTCGQWVCSDHQEECKQGCRTCPDCARHCSQCGEAIIWCKNHAVLDSGGDFYCRIHSVVCIGCRETYPVQKTKDCSICGQTICLNCSEHCAICGRVYCLSHSEKEGCLTCRTTNIQLTLF